MTGSIVVAAPEAVSSVYCAPPLATLIEFSSRSSGRNRHECDAIPEVRTGHRHPRDRRCACRNSTMRCSRVADAAMGPVPLSVTDGRLGRLDSVVSRFLLTRTPPTGSATALSCPYSGRRSFRRPTGRCGGDVPTRIVGVQIVAQPLAACSGWCRRHSRSDDRWCSNRCLEPLAVDDDRSILPPQNGLVLRFWL